MTFEFNLVWLLYHSGFEAKILYKNHPKFNVLLQQSFIHMPTGVWIGRNLGKFGCSWMRSSASSSGYVQLRSRLWEEPMSMLCVVYLPWLDVIQSMFSFRIAGVQGPGQSVQEYLDLLNTP